MQGLHKAKGFVWDHNQVWHVNFEDIDARKTISVPSEKAVSLLKLSRS